MLLLSLGLLLVTASYLVWSLEVQAAEFEQALQLCRAPKVHHLEPGPSQVAALTEAYGRAEAESSAELAFQRKQLKYSLRASARALTCASSLPPAALCIEVLSQFARGGVGRGSLGAGLEASSAFTILFLSLLVAVGAKMRWRWLAQRAEEKPGRAGKSPAPERPVQAALVSVAPSPVFRAPETLQRAPVSRAKIDRPSPTSQLASTPSLEFEDPG